MTRQNETTGYRRGVVLGFTVAEVVLLFVFCLLLLLAPTVVPLSGEASNPAVASSAASAGSSASSRPSGQTPAVASSAASASSSASSRPSGQTPAPPAASAEGRPPPPSGSPPVSIPPDWTVITEGGRDYVPTAEICVVTGIRREECAPRRIQEVLRGRGEHNWPPIIRFREADGEFFALGRAEITEGLAQKIKREIPTLLKQIEEYKVNVIEVIGHTDEQPVQGTTSNLDFIALKVVNEGVPAAQIVVTDNAGLGLARALAVVRVLRSDKRLDGVTILPLSAAQLTDTTGKLSDGKSAGDVKERRRIEIRLRRPDTPTVVVR